MQKLKDILFPIDLWLAGLIGFSGKYSISAECFKRQCVFCRFVRKVLGVEHCERAAKNEGI